VRFTIPQPPIEEYLVYSEDAGGYIAPGEGSHWDVEAWMRQFREEMANRSEEERREGCFTVDQLRASGALDVPPSWRKSLSAGTKERDLFADLPDDDDKSEDSQPQ